MQICEAHVAGTSCWAKGGEGQGKGEGWAWVGGGGGICRRSELTISQIWELTFEILV
jgi:hypothetical protein